MIMHVGTPNSSRFSPSAPIAVIGIGAVFPGCQEPGGFWRNILSGRDLITDVPPTHWLIEDHYDPDPAAPDKTYSKRGAFLPAVDFAPLEFGIPPTNLSSTDSAQLLGLIVAGQVLDDAALGPSSQTPRERISVILGVAAGLELLGEMTGRIQEPIWMKSLKENGIAEDKAAAICQSIKDHYTPWKESTFPGLLGNVVAGRIANHFDLGGTNCTADAACASSFAALSMALNELRLGRSDVVITGGVDTTNGPFLYTCFAKTPALSRSGDCRPFSEQADGMLLGEGVGMVALKRLADAERDNDRIYAVIKGIGASSDGAGASVYAPVAAGQAKALRRCYAETDYDVDTVELIEAHGTGTVAGDQAEFEALRTVFRESGRRDKQWCGLGAIKSQIGHTKSAAGIAGLTKAVLALHHKVLPPTIKVDRPNPKLGMDDSPFYLNTQTRPWIRDDAHPRRASVSSFGFGGTNFHIALEEYTGAGRRAHRKRSLSHELVLFCADAATDLGAQCRKTGRQSNPGGSLAHIARSSQESFKGQTGVRMAVVAADEDDLSRKLLQAAEQIGKTPDPAVSWPDGVYYAAGDPTPGQIAFLFPGQGSQYPGMGKDMAVHFEDARRVWDLAAAITADDPGPLHETVFPRPAFSDTGKQKQLTTLTGTRWAQPAIAACAASSLAVLRGLGIRPHYVGGHSLGEIPALFAADVIDLESLLKIAITRGRLMDGSTAAGAMTAVPLAAERVRDLLQDRWQNVVIANFNSPDQVVLSGPVRAIEQVELHLADNRIRTIRLNVSAAFHSPLMGPVSESFLECLNDTAFRPPSIPVFSNVTARTYPEEPDAMRRLLREQLDHPVRFSQQIEAMYAAGVRTYIEVGPGSVLTGLVSRCLKDRPHAAVAIDSRGRDGIQSLWAALGRLAVNGLAPDFGYLWQNSALPDDPRKTDKPKVLVSIRGCNYDRPYPPPEGNHPPPTSLSPQPAQKEPDMKQIPDTPEPEAPAPPEKETRQRDWPATGTNPSGNDGNGNETRDWFDAFKEIQRQTAESHQVFQRIMADAHIRFLKTVEASTHSLVAMRRGQYMEAPDIPHHDRIDTASAIPSGHHPPPTIGPEPMQEAPPPSAAPVAPDIDSGTTETTAPGPPPRSAEPAVAQAPRLDHKALLIRVVADKTGYPEDVLDLEMSLEADLGIDSIKRVEILSAIAEEAPGLPEVPMGDMADMKTLGHVLAFMEQQDVHQDEPPAPSASRMGFRDDDAAPLPSIVPANDPAASNGDLERWALEEIPAPYMGLTRNDLGSFTPLTIINDAAGVARALAPRLRDYGIEARVLDHVPDHAGGVVFLGGLKECPDIDAAIAIQQEAFSHARAVAARFAVSGGLFVTVQDTGGDFGISGQNNAKAWLGGLPGLIKTAAREWPGATVKAIDLEQGGQSVEEIADVLARELTAGGMELEVGLHADGRRTRLYTRPAILTADATPIGPDSVIVASGGGRGVTAAALKAVARAFRPRMVLLGRTPLTEEPAGCTGARTEKDIKKALAEAAAARDQKITPRALAGRTRQILAVREIRRTLKTLEDTGCRAQYLALDVQDASALKTALDAVRDQWGPITGIVHGAGVLSDKSLAEKTDEEFMAVFLTKVRGLWSLLSATAQDPLTVICLFSSIAARFGNPGQSDYAMANEILNKIARSEARRRDGACLVKSINWGPWDGGMVSSSLKAHFQKQGVALIDSEAGARMMVDELGDAGRENTEVIITRATGLGQLAMTSGGENTDLRVRVNRNTCPIIRSHRIAGSPVVPAMMSVEWFLRAAAMIRPDLSPQTCKDVKVLRGIRLAHFENHGDRLTIRCRRHAADNGKQLHLTLCDQEGEIGYTATVEMNGGPGHSHQAPSTAAPASPPGDLAPFAWDCSDIYNDLLFHGPDLQVIQLLNGVNETGAAAVVAGAGQMGWSPEPWRSDVAALDGGLQLALLWGIHLSGKKSLPTKIGACHVFRTGLMDGPIRCKLHGRAQGKDRTLCDIAFYDRHGTLAAQMCDVEMHMLDGA